MVNGYTYESFVEKYVKVIFKEKEHGLIGKLKKASKNTLVLKPVTIGPSKQEWDILGASTALERIVYQLKENTEAIVDVSAIAYLMDAGFLGIPSEEIDKHIKERESK